MKEIFPRDEYLLEEGKVLVEIVHLVLDQARDLLARALGTGKLCQLVNGRLDLLVRLVFDQSDRIARKHRPERDRRGDELIDPPTDEVPQVALKGLVLHGRPDAVIQEGRES